MITVFTPTYNRGKLLWRVFESLDKQTSKDFVWLIIDDGSVDNTRDIVADIRKKADFEIIYLYQKNGGKHRAFNLAVKKCKTDYFLILDSDDILVKDAMEILSEKCLLINNNENICGIIGNRGNISGTEIIGVKIPDVKVASGLELYQKMNFKGDTLRVYKKMILEQYPFPEINGENFIPENVVFDKIDKKYKMLVINEVLYLSEYQEDGLTKNINLIKTRNPIGYALSLRSMADTALTLKKKIGGVLLYILWTRKFHVKDSFKDFRNKFLYILCIPISYIMEIFHIPRFLFDMFRKVE